jgi:hypothetical protein
MAEELAPFIMKEAELLELCWVLFEFENTKRQRAERSVLDNNGCMRANNVHVVAFKVTTVSPAKEARAGVTVAIEGGGPKSVIGTG